MKEFYVNETRTRKIDHEPSVLCAARSMNDQSFCFPLHHHHHHHHHRITIAHHNGMKRRRLSRVRFLLQLASNRNGKDLFHKKKCNHREKSKFYFGCSLKSPSKKAHRRKKISVCGLGTKPARRKKEKKFFELNQENKTIYCYISISFHFDRIWSASATHHNTHKSHTRLFLRV
jgi:hypothetical protein